jgi:Fe-S-cluster containining protein
VKAFAAAWTRRQAHDTDPVVTRQSSRVRPLRVRPGARFACAGDGLCCSDVHALGPVRRHERTALQLIAPEVVQFHPRVATHVLTTGSDGRCLFLSEAGCALHASLGPLGKPQACRRFPFGLIATPDGGRITTEHRCPCRTMGDRPLLDVEAAEAALLGDAGRLRAERRAPGRIRLDSRRAWPFERWKEREGQILEDLGRGTPPAAVLDVIAFPELAYGSWEQMASDMLDTALGGAEERTRTSRYEAALAWFGAAILELRGTRADGAPHDRPWADAFDRAEARTSEPPARGACLADWVADEMWALRWASSGSFEGLRADLGTRLAVAEHLTEHLLRLGARADRAEAEAVTIVDLVGTSDWWGEVMRRMRLGARVS